MAASKVVLITGANTGIGYQIVRGLCGSDKSYNIILAGRSIDKVQNALASAQQEFPSTSSQLYALQVDIEHDDSIMAALETVKSKFDRLDALVNNAGWSR